MKKPLCSPFGGSKAAGKSQSSKLKGLLSFLIQPIYPALLTNLTYSPSLPSLTLPSPPLMEGGVPGDAAEDRVRCRSQIRVIAPRMTRCGSAPWQPRPITLSPRMSTSKGSRNTMGFASFLLRPFWPSLLGKRGANKPTNVTFVRPLSAARKGIRNTH